MRLQICMANPVMSHLYGLPKWRADQQFLFTFAKYHTLLYLLWHVKHFMKKQWLIIVSSHLDTFEFSWLL